jgi:hypothetical protein
MERFWFKKSKKVIQPGLFEFCPDPILQLAQVAEEAGFSIDPGDACQAVECLSLSVCVEFHVVSVQFPFQYGHVTGMDVQFAHPVVVSIQRI